MSAHSSGPGFSLAALQAERDALLTLVLSQPQHATAWHALGRLCQRLQDHPQALEAYQQALALEADHPAVWNDLARLQIERCDLKAAAEAVNRALALDPGLSACWLNIGHCEAMVGNLKGALEAFKRAKDCDPASAEPWIESAALMMRYRQATAAEAFVRAGLHQLPQAAELYWLLSRILTYTYRTDEAEAVARLALELAPERDFWRLQQALGRSETAFLLTASDQRVWLESLAQILEHWRDRRFSLAEMVPELDYLPELLWGLMFVTDLPHRQLREAYCRLFVQPSAPLKLRPRAKGEPWRLGLLITPGHEGVVSFGSPGLPLFLSLPAEFELVLLGDPLRLTPLIPPEAQGRVRVLQITANLTQALDTLRGAELDLLCFWEVGTDYLNFLLACQRLAPIQFASWGVSITSGSPMMDYFVSSALLELPEAQTHYSETLLLHPELPIYCPDPLPLQSPSSRSALGLPEEQRLYLCPQNLHRYSLDFIAALNDILQQDSEAVLVLLRGYDDWSQAQVEAAIAAEGLDTTRICWLAQPKGRQAFLSLLNLADLILDTRELSGGQTNEEALILGVPVVTYPGQSTRTRQTLARLKVLDLEDCMARDWQDYVRIALALAQPGPLRTSVLERLTKNRHRLVDNPAGPAGFTLLLHQMIADTLTDQASR